MKVKKLIALLLALVMVFALAACGDSGSQNSGSPAPSESTQPSEDAQPSESAPAAEPITLRIGYMPNYASLWGVLSADKQGYFAESRQNTNPNPCASSRSVYQMGIDTRH